MSGGLKAGALFPSTCRPAVCGVRVYMRVPQRVSCHNWSRRRVHVYMRMLQPAGQRLLLQHARGGGRCYLCRCPRGATAANTAAVGHASLPSDPPPPTSPCLCVLLPACLRIMSVACLRVNAGVRRVWSWLGPQAGAHLRRARASVQRSEGLVQLIFFVLPLFVTG